MYVGNILLIYLWLIKINQQFIKYIHKQFLLIHSFICPRIQYIHQFIGAVVHGRSQRGERVDHIDQNIMKLFLFQRKFLCILTVLMLMLMLMFIDVITYDI